MLKVGVQTKGILPEHEVWEGFRMIKNAGFEKIDFNLDTFLKNSDIYAGKINSFFDRDMEQLKEYFLPYLEAMKQYGITPSQMHAPYPVSVYGREQQNGYMKQIVIPKSIRIAQFLGVPYVVIHPFKLQYHLGVEGERAQNIEYFQSLIPLLKECGVKVCFENLYEAIGAHIVEGVCADPEDAIWYIDTLNACAGEPLFGFCLDTGHLQLTRRNPYQFIMKLGSRLKCLHIHENDAVGDLHQMPYTFGNDADSGTDWNKVMRGLRETGFDGTLSFETFPCVNSFPKPMTETVLKTICCVGMYFAEMISEKESGEKELGTKQSGEKHSAGKDASPLRLGIIGTGRIAGRFAESANAVEYVTLHSVYNPNRESAKAFAQAYAVPLYTDNWEEWISQIDAAYVASPHATHAAYCKALLQAGKHVLCEKPMCLHGEEAEALYELARQKKCVLREAVKTAYCPGFLAMIEMARSGKIGEIRDVEACFSKLTPTNLREMTDTVCGGSVTELGSYVLLPIWKLLGTQFTDMTYQSVYAENGVDTYTKLCFSFQNGMALAKTGLGVKSEGQLVIAGTKGYILCESPWWMTKKFEVRYEDASRREEYEYPYEGSGLQYELTAFVGEIREEKASPAEGEEPVAGVLPKESIASAKVMEEYLAKNKSRRTGPNQEKEKEVQIWAHRGCSMQYPENTLRAFRAAAELPHVTGIELDVQLTRDGQVIVFHDENTKRVMHGEKDIAQYTLEEIKSLKTRGAEEEDGLIPTLAQVLELLSPYCREKGLLINIELKTGVMPYPGIEEKTLRLVKQYGLERYVIYSSFRAETIKHIKELEPQAQTGMLAGTLSECIKWAQYAHADALHPWIGGMDCPVPDEWKQAPVRAWNMEEPFYRDGRILKERNLRKYQMFGVTDVFTNVPEIYENSISVKEA